VGDLYKSLRVSIQIDETNIRSRTSRFSTNDSFHMGCDIAGRYARVLSGRVKWVVLLFWMIVGGLACWQAPYALTRTTSAFTPPSSSLAAQGDALMAESFGESVGAPFALYVRGNSGPHWIASEGAEMFSEQVQQALLQMTGPASCGFNKSCVVSFQGYYSLRALSLPVATYGKFATTDGSSTFFSIAVNLRFSDPDAISFASQMEDVIERTRARCIPSAQCVLLGVPAFIPILLNDVEK
jgi:hypothetical protein